MKDYYSLGRDKSVFKNNYASAIKKITYSVPIVLENEDFVNESESISYTEKNYWVLT